jgi:uncharacterized protein YndB with AHSA1/START domain
MFIVVETTIKAPLATVWEHWTRKENLTGEWKPKTEVWALILQAFMTK